MLSQENTILRPGGERTEHIRITLTKQEKQRIAAAAVAHGNGQVAEEICACISWEPALYPPYRDAIFLDRLGRQVADHMCALHPPEGTEAYLLLSILASDEMAEKVM